MCVCPDTHDIFGNLLCVSPEAPLERPLGSALSHASPLVRYSFGWSKKTSWWLHRPTHKRAHTHTHYTVGSLLISRFLRFCMKLHRSTLLQLLPMTVSAVHDSFEVDTISFLSFLIYIFSPGFVCLRLWSSTCCACVSHFDLTAIGDRYLPEQRAWKRKELICQGLNRIGSGSPLIATHSTDTKLAIPSVRKAGAKRLPDDKP